MKLFVVSSATFPLPRLDGFAAVEQVTDTLPSSVYRFDAALIVGEEALMRGALIRARQSGLSAVAILLEEPSLTDTSAALALSESLSFASRVFAPPPIGEALLVRFTHIRSKLVPLPEEITPNDLLGTEDDSLSEALARLYRPRTVTPENEPEVVPSPSSDAPRPSLPIRAWRVLRRRGIAHVLRHVGQVIKSRLRRPRR